MSILWSCNSYPLMGFIGGWANLQFFASSPCCQLCPISSVRCGYPHRSTTQSPCFSFPAAPTIRSSQPSPSFLGCCSLFLSLPSLPGNGGGSSTCWICRITQYHVTGIIGAALNNIHGSSSDRWVDRHGLSDGRDLKQWLPPRFSLIIAFSVVGGRMNWVDALCRPVDFMDWLLTMTQTSTSKTIRLATLRQCYPYKRLFIHRLNLKAPAL